MWIDTVKSLAFFIIAGFFEIGGGYIVWLWLREGKGFEFAILGAILLILYGIIPTFQPATLPMEEYSLHCLFYGAGRLTMWFRINLI